MDKFMIASDRHNGSQSDKPQDSSPRDTALRVAVVEDNSAARELMKMLLELDGSFVTAAADGVAGVEMILRERPDVAFIDIGLPDLDGHQVARHIREELPKGDIYLVALTGYGDEDDRRASLEAGFNEHLVKPLKADDLHGLLRALRDRRAE
ncbi:MAG TPA: response regulator [Pirellulales bacterium]|jgi:CheY-like chemotaxis protein|nr:response regulator [Pirellulales bacterium]